MNASDLIALSPLVVISVTIVIALLSIVVLRSHVFTLILTLAGLLISFLSLRAAYNPVPVRISGLMLIDGYGIYFTGLIFVASFITALLSFGYLRKRRGDPEEFYLLLLSATLGAAILVASNHLVSFFLGLEILSVSLYAMIAYTTERERSLEASLKYLVLAATSSAFLLFGIALVYARCGTMQFDQIATSFSMIGGSENIFLIAGFCFIVVGIGFKLGLVPFHMWMPDVYEGAPAPVTGFLATVSKGAVFALLFRYFAGIRVDGTGTLSVVFVSIAIASMFAGNLLALQQTNVKRLLAYSSIAHLGYLLVAFIAGGRISAEAILFYFAAYFATILAAFGIVALMSDGATEPDAISDYRGLFWRRPWIAALFSIALFSLAGIPLTAGFIAKYMILTSGVHASLWTLVIVLAVNSAIGLYYYLRVIVSMFSDGGEEHAAAREFPAAGTLIMGSLVLVMVLLGVYPGPFMDLIHTLVAVSFM